MSIPDCTAAEVASCYIKMGLNYELKDRLHAEECFLYAIEKAEQGLSENNIPSVCLTAYAEYAFYLHRQRRFIDSYLYILKAKSQPCSCSGEFSNLKKELEHKEQEILNIVQTHFPTELFGHHPSSDHELRS